MQARPPGKKGTRADTGDAEGKGDHVTSTGVVATGSRLEKRRARKLAMEHNDSNARLSDLTPETADGSAVRERSLAKIERDEGDQGGDEQEDRVHC